MSVLTKSPDLLPAFDSVPTDRVAGNASGVSWGAVLAGAAGAAALSLILLILGVGLGLSSVSPWAQVGVSAATFGMSTILWITFTQIAASGMGGYLAGRLRTRWISVHTDEVYFRDTAHGFLAWAVASLATAALLGSVIGSIVGSGAQAGATAAGAVVSATAAGGAAAVAANAPKSGEDATQTGYFVDSLFRSVVGSTGAPQANGAAAAEGAPAEAASTDNGSTEMASAETAPPAGEVVRIFAANAGADALPADDARYLAQLVSRRTGMSQQDAEKRVTDTYAHMQAKIHDAANATKAAADSARKASSYGALWLFISLLIGAFVSSLAATVGGRQRDH